MNRLFWVCAAFCVVSGLWVAPAAAQSPAAKPAAAAAEAADSAGKPFGGLNLPNVDEVRLQVPRQVQAASALLGYGRQRLALVVGIGTLGSRQVLESATRDTQAVATALRAGGFVVMVREDVNGADLRAALKEYRERMQPGGVGFVYLTGLGAQVDGQNLLLPRNTRLDADASAAAVAAQVRASGVPMQEVVEALMSTPDSARLLVVDAAYSHPALAKLPQRGLAEQRLPPGMLALFSHALAATQEVPAIAALPMPLPKDPREIAGTRFARVLVDTLVTPRISAADALRNTHKALVEGAPDQAQPWLGGKSDNQEDLAEASLLDGLFPRTPEDLARETLKQITRAAVRDSRGSGGGGTTSASTPSPAINAPNPALPGGPSVPSVPPGGASALGSLTSTVSTVAGVAGSVATAAAGAATVAAGTQALAAAAASGTVATAATAATTAAAAVSTAGSVAGSVVGGTARILSTSSGEQAARQTVQTTLARAPVTNAAAAATSAAPAAATAAATTAAPAAATAAATTTAPAAATAAATSGAPAAATAAATSAVPAAATAAATTAAPAAATAAATSAAPAAAAGAVTPAVTALSAAAPLAGATPALPATASVAGGAPAAVSSLTPPTPAAALPGGSPVPSPTPPAAMAPPLAATPGSVAGSVASSAGTSAAGNTARNALDGRTQRVSEGGERPVYSPRTNRYGYTEGDTFTYQVTDAWKDEITGTFTTAIEEVLGDGQLLANGQTVEMDAQGRIKSQRRPDGTLARFEPQQDLWWSNPKPGQTRDVKFKEILERGSQQARQTEFEGSASVGKLRKIETPAGEFDAMPIETTGYFEGRLANGAPTGGRFSRTVWYSPKLGHPVRIDIADSDRMGKLLVRERVELMHAQRAPQP